jgi:hypothetical protein
MAAQREYRSVIGRTVAWVSLGLGAVGGSTTRGWGIGNWIASVASLGPDSWWWMPLAIYTSGLLLLGRDLKDKVPDLAAVFVVLALPSALYPFQGGAVGKWLNAPFVWFNDMLATHMEFLFGRGASISGVAGTTWAIALILAGFAAWRRYRDNKPIIPLVESLAGSKADQ